MTIKLYDPFMHWYEGNGTGGQIYFYSDPHFSDEEMKYLRKNYIGDDEQVERINSKIGKNDTIVILGDVGNVEYVKKIRGYKILIMGNHDSGASNYKRKEQYLDVSTIENPDMEFIKKNFRPVLSKFLPNMWYYDNRLFDEVYTGPLFISDKILLSHEPIDFPYALNIHGHDHSNWFENDHHLNLCAEHINYTPVSLKEIVQSGCLKNITSLHRATIDRATDRQNSI